MEQKPLSGGLKSISDDDLCAQCHDCEYRPGEMSSCSENWPGLEDDDGYVQTCGNFRVRDLTNRRFQCLASFVQDVKDAREFAQGPTFEKQTNFVKEKLC